MEKTNAKFTKGLFESVFSKKILINSILEFLSFKEGIIFSASNSIINSTFNETIKEINFDLKEIFKNELLLYNRFNNLEKLYLSDKHVSIFYKNIDRLNLPKLKNLFLLFNNKIDNYEKLLKFTNLNNLWFVGTKINKIKFVLQFKNLKEIHLLNNMYLNEDDYKDLKDLSKSVNIYLSIEYIQYFSNYEFIIHLPNLIELSLSLEKCLLVDPINFDNNTNLKILQLTNFRFSDYLFLKELKNLEELALINPSNSSRFPETDKISLDLQNNTNLTKLSIKNYRLEDFSFLFFLNNLEELTISNNVFSGTISLIKNTKLKKLFLKNISIKDNEFLKELPYLEELELFNAGGLNKNLIYLNYSKIKIIEIDEVIKYNDEYKEINISDQYCNWEIIKNIFKINLLKNINKLSLSENCDTDDIQWKDFTEIEELVLYCSPKNNLNDSNLKKLKCLSINNVTQEELLFLINQKFASLTEIILLNRENNEEALNLLNINIVKKIRICGKIIDISSNELNLSSCNLKNINFINTCKNKLKNMEKIFLQFNNLMTVIQLQNLNKITNLNLAGNNLEEIEFLKFPNCKYLESLSLRANINIKSFEPLAALTNIKILDLSALLQKNISFLEFIDISKLSILDIRGNKITDISPKLKSLLSMPNLNLKLTNNYEINFPNIKEKLLHLEKGELENLDESEIQYIKVITLGNRDSGKSQFINKITKNKFVDNSISNRIVNNFDRYLYRDSILIMDVYDTIYKGRYSDFNVSYNSAFCALVFFKANSKSIISNDNIDDAKYFLDKVEYISSHYKTEKINLYLIGNSFGDGEYSIQKNIAEETAKEYNAKYFEISCNDGTGIEELMMNIFTDYVLANYENFQPLKTSSEKLNKINKKNNKNCNIY